VRGREKGEGKGREWKGMKGKNVLPHVKQAVAAYAHMPQLRHATGVL